MVFHTTLAPYAPWPGREAPPTKLSKRRPDKVSPHAWAARRFIAEHPGCKVREIADAIGKPYTNAYDHVLHGIRTGAYTKTDQGVFLC